VISRTRLVNSWWLSRVQWQYFMHIQYEASRQKNKMIILSTKLGTTYILAMLNKYTAISDTTN
jgi:ERCC4-related helicase